MHGSKLANGDSWSTKGWPNPGTWRSYDPRIDMAVDQALAAADVEVRAAFEAAIVVILRAEGWLFHRHLLARSDRLGPGVAERIVRGKAVDEADYQRAFGQQAGWRALLEMLFEQAGWGRRVKALRLL